MRLSLLLVVGYVTLIFSTNVDAVDIKVPYESDEQSEARVYEGKWKTLTLDNEGNWIHTSTITEQLHFNDEDQLEHIQAQFPVGKTVKDGSQTVRLLRPHDYFVTSLMQTVGSAIQVEDQPSVIKAKFDDKSVSRSFESTAGKKVDHPAVPLPFNGFDGFILGLVLANFELEADKVIRLPVIMPGALIPYWVDAYVKNGKDVTAYGKKQAVWQVDTEWLDVSSGSSNPKGPDKSGGSYYIFKKPMQGLPAVYRYKNTAVDIILE